MEGDNQNSAGGEHHPPVPINLRKPHSDETGFLIVRLKPGTNLNQNLDLATAAGEAGLSQISDTVKALSLEAEPLIDPDTAAKLRKVEEDTSASLSAQTPSLSAYWRVDARETPHPIEKIEETLRSLPGVDLVYREKTVTDPVMADNDVHAGLEHFLDAAPVGVNARWVWNQDNGDGSGMHFIDLEQGWSPHEDLPPFNVIFNDNIDEHGGDGRHGTAVLGIVAGVDNTVGVVGIAPNVESVRVVSHWNVDPAKRSITKALAAAIIADPPPHVILIEAQIGVPELPVETDPATFDAIQLAVANGIIVIEAAANGNVDLDPILGPDSGAIIVGAGTSGPGGVHNRSIWDESQGSNFGAGVHCYAWGDSIVSAGYGDLPPGFGATSYTRTFGGTSGAAAIIAGCALLLQGLHLAAHGSPMSPADIRSLLSNPSTGTPHSNDIPGDIGVMPDLKKIVEDLM